MRQLNTGERHGSCPERLEPQHRRAPTFDRAMILLDDVV